MILHIYLTEAVPNNQKLQFLTAFRILTWPHRQQACPFPAGVVSLVSGAVKNVVQSNSLELEQLFMPMWLDLTTVPAGSNARLTRIELSPFNLILIALVVSPSSPTIRSLILPPCPSVMCRGV